MSDLAQNYIDMLQNKCFLQRLLVYSVNNRIQDFTDPLTTTLSLMLLSPIQVIFCESGLLPFKTSLLPVIPYNFFELKEIQLLKQIISDIPISQQKETMETSGQYTLTVKLNSPTKNVFIDKKSILNAFIHVIFKNNAVYNDKQICKALCNIVLQRLMARTNISSDIMEDIMTNMNDYCLQNNE